MQIFRKRTSQTEEQVSASACELELTEEEIGTAYSMSNARKDMAELRRVKESNCEECQVQAGLQHGILWNLILLWW